MLMLIIIFCTFFHVMLILLLVDLCMCLPVFHNPVVFSNSIGAGSTISHNEHGMVDIVV